MSQLWKRLLSFVKRNESQHLESLDDCPKICVKHFSHYPGPATRKEGANSGQNFLEDFFVDAYALAKCNNKKLIIDLDDTTGYGIDWLEYVFAGYDFDEFIFISNEEPDLIDLIKQITEKNANLFDEIS